MKGDEQMELNENVIYTADETKSLLKISQSTFLRLVKKGVLRAYKVGGQYRILGKEILHLVSPKLEAKAADAYRKVKYNVKKSLEKVKD
ncbi:helix-turn-helix domain-containing protein [Candidatus Margulisiibacteriota bacterium]